MNSLVPASGAAAAAWIGLERRRPLRRANAGDPDRMSHNCLLAVAGGLVARFLEQPLVDPLARHVERRRLGIAQRLRLARPAADFVAIVLLDYTLYVWHVLLHRSVLYRFHQLHHSDTQLDLSTAVRFHAAELVVSVPWRLGQVRLPRRHAHGESAARSVRTPRGSAHGARCGQQ